LSYRNKRYVKISIIIYISVIKKDTTFKTINFFYDKITSNRLIITKYFNIELINLYYISSIMKINHPKIKVLILWGIVLCSFTGFWIGHVYISNYQTFVAPQNYLVRAKHYLQEGQKEKALQEIEWGMNTFRPVSSETLAFLMKIKKDNLEENKYNELEKKYQITMLLEKCNSSENIQLDTKILDTCEISFPSLSKSTQSSVFSLWKLLTRRTLKCMQGINLSGNQILNFLYYSGGIFCGNSNIGNTGITVDDDLLIVSEGSAEGSGAQIWFQGKNYAGNRRGFYVFILTPPPCKVFRADRFDIWESRNEAIKMEQFLGEVPEGYIGAFAVADEATENMTDTLEQILLRFGFSKQTYDRNELELFGYGYAFAGIGVKGVKEGTAVQNWAKYDPSKKSIPIAVVGILKGGEKK